MTPTTSDSAKSATMWLRPLALVVLGFGLAAERGRVFLESVEQCMVYSQGPLHDRFGHATGVPYLDPCFCMLLSFFREILIYPTGRAFCLLFVAYAAPFLLHLFLRARTGSQIFRAFLLVMIGQIITFGATVSLFYSFTEVPSVRDAKDKSNVQAYLNRNPRRSVSIKYAVWILLVLSLSTPTFLGLMLTPTENDAAYVYANGLFQLYPLVFLLALFVAPLRKNFSTGGQIVPYRKRAAGVRLVVRILRLFSWISALLWWAGIVALFVKPAVTNEATFGSRHDTVSPIIDSLMAGRWEWHIPNLIELKGGPIFFLSDLVSSILATWSSQIESGYEPSIMQAVAFGPPFALVRSFAKTWQDAL